MRDSYRKAYTCDNQQSRNFIRIANGAQSVASVSFLSPVHTSNNVEATFDFVEATFDIVAFDNVSSTLLLVWTGL